MNSKEEFEKWWIKETGFPFDWDDCYNGDNTDWAMRAYKAAWDKQQERIDELTEFCIWLTGCGYDFTQHEYFCKQRDKLLIGQPQEDN